MRGLALACGLLFLANCGSVQRRELVGNWSMLDVSRTSLPPELKGVQGTLVLGDDGRFSASHLPGLFYVPGRRDARAESGNGAWKLVNRRGAQQVQLDFESIENWKGPLPYGTQLEVSGGRLYYFLGDPDEGRRMAFGKK